MTGRHSRWGDDAGRPDLEAGARFDLYLLVVLGLIIYATVLSIQPDHHHPPCGGSNLVVAVAGPQGPYADTPGDRGCQPLATVDVSAATVLVVGPCVLFPLVILRRTRRHPPADEAATSPAPWRP
ncbi:MAG: hypothetical protein ACRDZY_04395 [Acidimicrobiales bacterium]